MTRFYWDSCAFIGRIQGDPSRIIDLKFLTDEAAAGRVQIVASALAVAEVSYIRRECSEAEKLRDIEEIGKFFDNDYIHIVQVTRHIATEAAKIAVRHKVKPPDAIHLATAIASNCQVVHTYDNVLLKLDGKVGAPALTIKAPPAAERGLFDELESAGDDDEPPPASPGGPNRRNLKSQMVVGGCWITPARRPWGRVAAFLPR